MKLKKRLTSFYIVICMLISLPCFAFADEDSAFEGKTWDELVGELLETHSTDEEHVGLGYLNTVTGEEHYINADKYMVAASMYKVPLNMYYARMVSQGEMDWDTEVYGIKYEWLMEDSIISSNNDYAEILWRNMGGGSYNNYRRLIAPLMGEDADTVDAKYYENNFFTPRQMIFCLKLLYEQREDFPRIIETMQQAEPENYFKLNERRFDIAHKYGFLQEEYHYYVNDCGLAFTDDPIALVVFTDNVPNAYDLMTDYCTLMCDYTQYNTALRLEEEKNQPSPTPEITESPIPEEAEPLPETQQLEENDGEQTATGYMPVAGGIALCIVFIAVIGGITLLIINRGGRRRG